MALTLGPQDAEGALRAALAIGADQAVRLWNPLADEWGPFTIAAALAAAIRQQFPMPDLVLCGDISSDWSSGTVGPALAELLDLPQITGIAQLSVLQAVSRNEHRARCGDIASDAQTRTRLPRTACGATAAAADRYWRPERAALSFAASAYGRAESQHHCPRPTKWLDNAYFLETDETTLLEMHVPRPLPRRIIAPDSHHSAFQRIGEFVAGATTGRKTRLVEGSNEELARTLSSSYARRGFWQEISLQSPEICFPPSPRLIEKI